MSGYELRDHPKKLVGARLTEIPFIHIFNILF